MGIRLMFGKKGYFYLEKESLFENCFPTQNKIYKRNFLTPRRTQGTLFITFNKIASKLMSCLNLLIFSYQIRNIS